MGQVGWGKTKHSMWESVCKCSSIVPWPKVSCMQVCLISIQTRNLISDSNHLGCYIEEEEEEEKKGSSCGHEAGEILGQTSDIFISDESLQFNPLTFQSWTSFMKLCRMDCLTMHVEKLRQPNTPTVMTLTGLLICNIDMQLLYVFLYVYIYLSSSTWHD